MHTSIFLLSITFIHRFASGIYSGEHPHLLQFDKGIYEVHIFLIFEGSINTCEYQLF